MSLFKKISAEEFYDKSNKKRMMDAARGDVRFMNKKAWLKAYTYLFDKKT